MNNIIIGILIVSSIILGILIFQKYKSKESYQIGSLDIINLILYTPLQTRDLIGIVNKFENQPEFKRKMKEIIGFLRSSSFSRAKDYFMNEAKRYMMDKDIFNKENLENFIQGMKDEIRKIQIQEDDLD